MAESAVAVSRRRRARRASLRGGRLRLRRSARGGAALAPSARLARGGHRPHRRRPRGSTISTRATACRSSSSRSTPSVSRETADVAFVSYPHGAAAEAVAELRERGLRVVDLSADFRLHDLAAYERWYGAHGAPALLGEAVFGLTELHRDEIAAATLVANPGCYSTAAILALAPLARDGPDRRRGGGREERRVRRGPRGDERHPLRVGRRERDAVRGRGSPPRAPRSTRSSARSGCDARVTFVPHLLPLDQGLLASCYVTTTRELTDDELDELFADAYGGRAVRRARRPTAGRARRARHEHLPRSTRTSRRPTGACWCFAAIDNLWKGAAGQAVQNLNVMLGHRRGGLGLR